VTESLLLVLASDTITSFHALFLKELEKSENFSVDGFALTFLKFSDYLKLYTPYINGYNRAMASYDALVGTWDCYWMNRAVIAYVSVPCAC